MIDAGRLRALGLPVLLPTRLPEGFAPAGVEVDEDPDWGPSYRATWRGPAGETLTVEGTRAGFGDIPRGRSRLPFHCPALGAGTVEVYEADLRTPWVLPEPDGPGYALWARGITPEQAVEVLESLAPAG